MTLSGTGWGSFQRSSTAAQSTGFRYFWQCLLHTVFKNVLIWATLLSSCVHFSSKLIPVLPSWHTVVHGNYIKNMRSILNNSCPFMAHRLRTIRFLQHMDMVQFEANCWSGSVSKYVPETLCSTAVVTVNTVIVLALQNTETKNNHCFISKHQD